MLGCLVLVCQLVTGVVTPVAAAKYEKGWVDVNFGAAIAAEPEYTSVKVITISQEPGGGAVAYSVPRGASFDVSGGYMLNSRIGIGASLAGTAHQDIAGLAVVVPHPKFFDASATDATVTDGLLTRVEGAQHIFVMLVTSVSPRVRVRLFGGPSHYRVEQDTVDSIRYTQSTFGIANVVNITSYTTSTSVGGGWGAHVGGDVSVFFSRVVGIGGMVRVSAGRATLEDYSGPERRGVGGIQFGGGLRLKF